MEYSLQFGDEVIIQDGNFKGEVALILYPYTEGYAPVQLGKKYVAVLMLHGEKQPNYHMIIIVEESKVAVTRILRC